MEQRLDKTGTKTRRMRKERKYLVIDNLVVCRLCNHNIVLVTVLVTIIL